MHGMNITKIDNMEMKTIAEIWFSENRIFMKTEQGEIYSRPLESFPLLKNATDAERLNFKIGMLKDDVRWENIDEDIHIDNFFSDEEPKLNPIGNFFSAHPQINVSSFAKQIRINKSLMAKYIYGIKTPSKKRKKEIQFGLHELATELSSVEFA